MTLKSARRQFLRPPLRNRKSSKRSTDSKKTSEAYSEKMGVFFRGRQSGRRWNLARSPRRQRRWSCRDDQDWPARARGVHHLHGSLRLLLQERQEVPTGTEEAGGRYRREARTDHQEEAWRSEE